ncbi:hypothetical protein [Aequorivita antarctica]|uniref:Uncharacterized protein n=1 Tax=Aequorivita antarctica TaxID=153266 RepID=A0A5C6YVA3_9FLAO|nr:hypothetical protein [Aequorivita antarctica]TXD71272.1 hypothetical protein ESU54_17430 [Aequorivita antarctica]SRX76515.1 hypothetical protein AEQU3_03515 [Aequorivita antarctica]
MHIKKSLIIVFSFLCIGCSSDETKMTETDKYLADKFNAEWAELGFKTLRTETNSKLTENRQFLFFEIKNMVDIERIMDNTDYYKERGMTIANFIKDSIQYDELPFQPKEIQIDFISESGFYLLSSEKRKSILFDLNY